MEERLFEYEVRSPIVKFSLLASVEADSIRMPTTAVSLLITKFSTSRL
jgi:hypothetical protein